MSSNRPWWSGCLVAAAYIIGGLLVLGLVSTTLSLFGIALGLLGAVLAYKSPTYRLWLQHQRGYSRRLSKLPGFGDSGPGTLAVSTLLYLLPISFIFWFLYGGSLRSESMIYIIFFGLLGAILLYGWFIRGWGLDRSITISPPALEGIDLIPTVFNEVRSTNYMLIPVVLAVISPFLCFGAAALFFPEEAIEIASQVEADSPVVVDEPSVIDSPPQPILTSTFTIEPSVTLEPSSTPSPLPSATAFYEGMEEAIVVGVIDGDTIEVKIDGVTQQLRYIGIDTPEVGQPYFEESDQANRSLLQIGGVVYLEQDVSEVDKFGRLLRYVYLPNETFVNGALVAVGMAFSKAYSPDIKHQGFLNQLEAEAKEAEVGMWETILYTPTPEPGTPVINIIVDFTCSQFNSPGDDNDSKEEEYACFTNRGSSSVSMTGWKVVDEFGWTFTFPSFTLSSNSSVRVRTGCGSNSASDLYWCKGGSAVWNNGGDTVHLYDQSSNLIVKRSYQ